MKSWHFTMSPSDMISGLQVGMSGALQEEREGDLRRRLSDMIKLAGEAKKAAQHRMHLTALGVGMLAFLAGFGVGWFVFVC